VPVIARVVILQLLAEAGLVETGIEKVRREFRLVIAVFFFLFLFFFFIFSFFFYFFFFLAHDQKRLAPEKPSLSRRRRRGCVVVVVGAHRPGAQNSATDGLVQGRCQNGIRWDGTGLQGKNEWRR